MYEVHADREEENKEIACNLCGSTFPAIENLKEHEKKEHKEELPCNFCSKSLESKKELMSHKKKEHQEKVSSC